MRIAGVLHYGGHIGEIQIDKTRQFDKIRNALDTLPQNIVGNRERIQQGNALLADKFETFIGDYDEGIHMIFQRRNAAFCLLHTAPALKIKRFGDNPNRKDTHIVRNFGDDRRRARSRAAAHTGRDKDHIAAADGRSNCFTAFVGSFLTHFGFGARPFSMGYLFPDLNLLSSLGTVQGLPVCIDADKLNTLHAACHHSVDGIPAAAAYPNYFYLYDIVKIVVDLKRHLPHLP